GRPSTRRRGGWAAARRALAGAPRRPRGTSPPDSPRAGAGTATTRRRGGWGGRRRSWASPEVPRPPACNTAGGRTAGTEGGPLVHCPRGCRRGSLGSRHSPQAAMRSRSMRLIGAFIVLALAACATTTQFVNTWKATDAAPLALRQGDTVVAMVISRNETNRRSGE